MAFLRIRAGEVGRRLPGLIPGVSALLKDSGGLQVAPLSTRQHRRLRLMEQAWFSCSEYRDERHHPDPGCRLSPPDVAQLRNTSCQLAAPEHRENTRNIIDPPQVFRAFLED